MFASYNSRRTGPILLNGKQLWQSTLYFSSGSYCLRVFPNLLRTRFSPKNRQRILACCSARCRVCRPTGRCCCPTSGRCGRRASRSKLGNFPVNVALHPQGDWAAVLHSGYGPHEVVVVDLKTASVVSRVTLPKTFYGLCFTPNGKRLLVSGGEDNVVYRFHFADGHLSDREAIELPGKTRRPR